MSCKTYYLASGLWSESDKKLLDKYEKLIETHSVDILSPRKLQRAEYDLKLDDPMRDVFIQEIFRENVVAINSSQHLLVNLSEPYDIGTLWELGYFLSKSPQSSDITVINGNSELAEKWLNMLRDFHNNNLPPYVPTKVTYYIESYEDVVSKLKSIISRNASICINIDDRNPDCIIALGYFYGLYQGGDKIFTYTTQDHGSNVMIAGAIGNHFKFKPKDRDLRVTLSKYEMHKETK